MKLAYQSLCYRYGMSSPASRVPGSSLPVPKSDCNAAGGAAQPDGAQMPAAGESAGGPPPHRIPRWLVRLELLLRVMLRMYVGIAVCYAPWSPTFWDQNPVFAQFPAISVYAANGAVRGIVSGLGLLNLWIAIQDALQHRER